MGGYGSGRWYSYGGKRTTESQHRIDIRWLKKHGHLQPGMAGTLSWSSNGEQTGSIGYRMEKDRMIVNYRHRPHGEEWQSVEHPIFFDLTPCNYGGKRRAWLLCPHCQRRVAVLYGAGKYFLCRHCHDLAYSSQQEGVADRLMRKARKIRRKLGITAPSLMEPILYKPKHMHQKTFDRLRMEAEQANDLSWLIIAQKLSFDARDFP